MFSELQNGYLIFHLVFTLPLIAVLTYFQPNLGKLRNKRRWQSFIILLLIAYIYTIPWDNLMISFDAWWYGDVVWKKIWYAPVGEYMFFGIQTIIAGLYLYYLDFDPKPVEKDLNLTFRVAGFSIFISLFLISVVGLLYGPESVFYGAGILAWTSPVMAIQWLVGGTYILRKWKKITMSLVPPTVYMWLIDAFAISVGLWTISPDKTIGLSIGPLPVEEMIFFLVANVMTVFGMVLYEWVLEVWKCGDNIFFQTDHDKICRLYHLFE